MIFAFYVIANRYINVGQYSNAVRSKSKQIATVKVAKACITATQIDPSYLPAGAYVHPY